MTLVDDAPEVVEPAEAQATKQKYEQEQTQKNKKKSARRESSLSPAQQREVWWVLSALMVSMLLGSLDQMIFATALPTIVGELGGVDHMMWVMTAFLLAETIMLPIYGKLGDLWGRKYLFIGVLTLFLVGSVMGGTADSMLDLIAGRAVQGLGAGGMMVLAQAILADVVPPRERGRYVGVMGGVFGLSAVLGPLLGGWFTEGPGWRWAFWMNIPLGILAIAVAAVVLRQPELPSNRPRWDYAGTLLILISSSSLVLFSTWGGTRYEWSSPTIVWLIRLCVVSTALFLWVERRAENPLVPLQFFRNRNFALTTAVSLVVGITMFGVLGYLPTYLQMVHGFNATEAGYMMIPMMVSMMSTSIWTGRRITRTGHYRHYPRVGMAIVLVALLLFHSMNVTTPTWVVGAYLFLFGIGLGLTMQVLVLIVQNTLPLKVVGTATAVNNFFRQVGATLGSALVGGLFVSRLTSVLTERVPAAIATLSPAQQAEIATHGGIHSNAVTPDLVASLPDALRTVFVQAYNDALIPIFLYVMPLAVVSFLLMLFIKHEKLRETNRR